jgi:hypothetical protein
MLIQEQAKCFFGTGVEIIDLSFLVLSAFELARIFGGNILRVE